MLQNMLQVSLTYFFNKDSYCYMIRCLLYQEYAERGYYVNRQLLLLTVSILH